MYLATLKQNISVTCKLVTYSLLSARGKYVILRSQTVINVPIKHRLKPCSHQKSRDTVHGKKKIQAMTDFLRVLPDFVANKLLRGK